MKEILIFGGTFDPPHSGHMRALTLVAAAHPWDEIWIVPSGSRRDKQIGTWQQDRLALVEAFAEDAREQIRIPIRVELCELNAGVPTSTYATLHTLQSQHAGSRFWLFVSSETVSQIKEFWVRGRELYESARFAILPRPGFPLPSQLPPHSMVIAELGLDLSSTRVREQAHAHQDIECLVSPRVRQVITDRGMYRNSRG